MSSSPPGKLSFTDRWIAETVRVHERHAGRLEDNREVARLRAAREPVERGIIRRAVVLAEKNGLIGAVQQWQNALRWGLTALALLALGSGFAAALTVLGDSQAQVNIVWTLTALLGLNLLMLGFWLLGMLAGGRGGGALGRSWLMVTRLTGGAGRSSAARAFLSLGSGCGVHRWMFSAVTHGFWCLYTLAAMVALLIALSLRAYDFVWETTILSSGVFVHIVQWSAWLPAQAGFVVPDETMVRASALSNDVVDGEILRRAWSSWLLGCLLVYGLMPRLVLLLGSLGLFFLRLRQCRLDPYSPEWAALSARLSPASEPGGVVDPDTRSSGVPGLQHDPQADGPPVLLAVELGPDITWPPTGWDGDVPEMLGPADDRDRRQGAQIRLQAIRPVRLLLAVDARLSPDRGLLNWLLALSGHCASMALWLLRAEEAGPDRLESWRDSLEASGIRRPYQYTDAGPARQWLHGEVSGE